ncbi:hypothetical protein FISHEDRAFT_73671 [Fistulina hepatica ATCC 64428]|uniref:Protein HRI1 n=1 Tax=Fistulina hepatica ATCC 64428 TaxID=1128425 RepID=A0A0D7ACU3_9AGAR|nr:hypothetical protein FISHEDRAFT_73671 [Fistulina hepatica ATCC 64428]
MSLANGSISFRRSLHWTSSQAAPSEPTDTVVLANLDSGAFVDVRFFTGSNELDWAFSGYREAIAPNITRFRHLLDSRNEDPSSIVDQGTTVILPDGTAKEVGTMLNPSTRQEEPYEEIWQDVEHPDAIIARRQTEKTDQWIARVGSWQLGVGRNPEVFAWSAHFVNGSWAIRHATDGCGPKLIPDDGKIGPEWTIL